MQLGEKIKAFRLKKGMTQQELAKLVGMSVTYLSKIENSRTGYLPKERILLRIAKHLNICEEDIIYDVQIHLLSEHKLSTHYAKVLLKLFDKYGTTLLTELQTLAEKETNVE